MRCSAYEGCQLPRARSRVFLVGFRGVNPRSAARGGSFQERVGASQVRRKCAEMKGRRHLLLFGLNQTLSLPKSIKRQVSKTGTAAQYQSSIPWIVNCPGDTLALNTRLVAAVVCSRARD
jgi:hypothetical protein